MPARASSGAGSEALQARTPGLVVRLQEIEEREKDIHRRVRTRAMLLSAVAAGIGAAFTALLGAPSTVALTMLAAFAGGYAIGHVAAVAGERRARREGIEEDKTRAYSNAQRLRGERLRQLSPAVARIMDEALRAEDPSESGRIAQIPAT